MFRILAVNLSGGMHAAALQDKASGRVYLAGSGEHEPWTLEPMTGDLRALQQHNFFILPDTWGEAVTDEVSRDAVAVAYETCPKPPPEG